MLAGAFFGFTPVLLPYNQPHAIVMDLLRQTNADALVAQAGSLPLEELSRAAGGLKQVIWVVENTSRHVGWSDVPNSIGTKIGVSTWHELVEQQRSSPAELPADGSGRKPGNLVAVWQSRSGADAEIVEFTQAASASDQQGRRTSTDNKSRRM